MKTSEPSAPGAAPGRGRRSALAIMLALLLPLALATCGEADQTEDEAAEGQPADDNAEEAGLPARARDADGVLMPRVYMPDEPDTLLPDAFRDTAAIPAKPAPVVTFTTTRVRALDKITARVSELDLPEDTDVRFGTLSIRARTCRSRPPEEQPETFAYLEIDDVMTSDEHVRVFAGWMMASSPALNALEHPVYDVWVIACKTSSADASSASE